MYVYVYVNVYVYVYVYSYVHVYVYVNAYVYVYINITCSMYAYFVRMHPRCHYDCLLTVEASLKGWDRCPASSYSLVPTNIMRIYHFLPFWYAFLVTPHLGCLISGIHDALLGASTGLCMASLLNLMMPGGAGGMNYLPEDFWQKAWLPFGYHSFAAILFAVCSTYLLFFSSTSVGQKQYALGVFSELLVPFMNPQTTSGFRAVIWDWEFNWNWNGVAMCGFWLVVLAILLAIPSLGLLPWSRESVKRHSCMWSAATELAQLAEDTAGCLEYLLTILQQEAWKFPFHADSSNFYIRQLGMRRTTAEALLDQAQAQFVVSRLPHYPTLWITSAAL